MLRAPKMNLPLKAKLGLLCAVFIAILAITTSLLLYGLADIERNFSRTVMVTGASIRNAQMLQQLIIDAETGQRGYIITGDDEFLAPYTNANRNFTRVIRALREDLKDSPDQITALNEIQDLQTNWKTEAGEPEIQLRRQVGLSKTSLKQINDMISVGTGKRILDQMRGIIADLEKELKQAGRTNALILTLEMGRAIVDSETGQRGFILTGDEAFLEPYYQGQSVFYEKQTFLTGLFINKSDDLARLTRIKALYKDWLFKAARPEIDARVAYEKNPRSIEDLSRLLGEGKGKSIIDELREKSGNFITTLQSQVNRSLANAQNEARIITTIGMIGVPTAIILSIILTTLFARSIVQAIALLVNSTKILSTGNLSHRIKIDSADEFGKLAEAFNFMAGRIEDVQKQLIETNKMASLGAMSSGIAHELNQPLGAILLKTELIPDLIQHKKYDKISAIVASMKDQILRAKKIMDSLRIFSREDGAKSREAYKLNDIVKDIIPLFEEEFKLAKIDFSVKLTEENNMVFVSPVQIGQVLSNLLVNARDAVAGSNLKHIKLYTERLNGSVFLTVSDNGTGIPANKLGKIFEPFYTTKPIGKGTGLGLSLSYRMVQDNDGEIKVSSHEGEGTEFLVNFPALKDL